MKVENLSPGSHNQQNSFNPEAFWRELLRDFTAPTPLVVDKNRITDKNQTTQSGFKEQEYRLSKKNTLMLESLAQQHKIKIYTLLEGAWAILLSRYSGEEDIVFGANITNHQISDYQSQNTIKIITLPVRLRVCQSKPLLLWLKKIQDQWMAAGEYKDSPLAKIQEWSELPPETPLFESLLVFENNSNEVKLSPLTLVANLEPELLIKIKYDSQRFDDATIERMLGHIQTLLESMANLPWQRLVDLPMLTDCESHQLLVEWHNQTNSPLDVSIHQLFEKQVELTPDTIAVIFEEKQLNYQELNAKANKLAHHLQTLGVGPEVLVGICVERSLEMVIGLLGIIKAGGAYVPLDPAYPQDRLAFMLQDTQVSVLVTQQHLVDIIPQHKAHIIALDTDWAEIDRNPTHNPTQQAAPNNLAYVIYTSGSTGQPKGVAIEHQVICQQLLWRQETFNLTSKDRILQTIPLAFDPSVWQIFGTLIAGSTLVIAPPGAHQDSACIAKLVAKYQIAILDFVPSMLQIFLAEPSLENCTSLKHVFCGGEALPAQLVQQFQTRLQATLSNQYGPTEACIDTTFWKSDIGVCNGQICPIGRPIANKQVYILDSHLQSVPIGVPGELYIGGGLARGYLNRPELTAERFITNPFNEAFNNPKSKIQNPKSERLYKSGDLARYLPDGNIEYLGRIDNQVKIRGVRIEVGEIEARLNQHPEIRESVIIARPDLQGNTCLVAYVIPKLDSTSTKVLTKNLRLSLSQQLPDYMIPSAFVVLETLPTLPNGKINRLALPEPDWFSANEETFVAPRNAIEQILADIFAEVIGLEQVGIYDNFFELGGHSLLATQVISRASDSFGVDLSVSYLFENPTVAELSFSIQKDPEIGLKVEKTAQLLVNLAQLSDEEVEKMLLEPDYAVGTRHN